MSPRAESVLRSRASSVHERAAITGRPVVGPYQSPVFGRARSPSAPQNVVTWNYNGNSAVAILVAFVQHSRSECVFVYRGGGFRVLKPCQRPTGLSGGMPHGEGRRPSSRGGIPTRWTARSAGRQGFGRSWSRVAQIHICQYMHNTQMQAIHRILA